MDSLNAYNLKNRQFARIFMIEMYQGLFARKMLMIPKYSSEFLAFLNEYGISLLIINKMLVIRFTRNSSGSSLERFRCHRDHLVKNP